LGDLRGHFGLVAPILPTMPVFGGRGHLCGWFERETALAKRRGLPHARMTHIAVLRTGTTGATLRETHQQSQESLIVSLQLLMLISPCVS
jgi:hypothetical protein